MQINIKKIIKTKKKIKQYYFNKNVDLVTPDWLDKPGSGAITWTGYVRPCIKNIETAIMHALLRLLKWNNKEDIIEHDYWSVSWEGK